MPHGTTERQIGHVLRQVMGPDAQSAASSEGVAWKEIHSPARFKGRAQPVDPDGAARARPEMPDLVGGKANMT